MKKNFNKLIESSIIKGLAFCAFDTLGPQPIYMFPPPLEMEELEIKKTEDKADNILTISLRDYIQIAIKNISLLIGDGAVYNKEIEILRKYQYFGIIPFPDLQLTSLTYFHFIDIESTEIPTASAFCILIDEKRRSFLYNNINRLKNIVIDFFSEFDKKMITEFPPQEQVESDFNGLLKKIITIEETPSTPISSQRKMKILIAGLDNSGKTSFLLSVDRKFSKLIGLSPTRGADVSSIEALGATIFLWDLGGQKKYHEKYLNKAQIYLFEADLLFYFIDIRDRDRFEESLEYLNKMKKALSDLEQNTPIIYVLSKGDSDIIESKEIKSNIKSITNKLTKLSQDGPPEIYITSLFEIFSILRAFSSGVAKLSPNRNLVEHNLEEFSTTTGAFLILLLSSDGLVLAESFRPKALKITEMEKSEDLLNVFEVVAPQFTMLFKIFANFKATEKDEATFKVSDSVILFKKIRVLNYDMYVLFLLDEENKKDLINQNLQEFLKRTQDLLIRYIS
ncbi:MAG: 50S ribosome-binding GTPase [Candidatus Lokiarchaeota archaeon]|nr:50S ribosome-binding GTPase [Candidatus Lokiarchaeota archaeon]